MVNCLKIHVRRENHDEFFRLPWSEDEFPVSLFQAFRFHRRSLVIFPSLPSFFPALSLALFFARAPLSERLEQASFPVKTVFRHL